MPRTISLAPSNTEIIYALGAEAQLVAVTSFCDYPSAAKKLPRLPGWSTIKAADVLALKPDLVLTSSICQGELKAALEAAKVKVVHFDPRSLLEVAESFIRIGELVGRDGKPLAENFLREIKELAPPHGTPCPRIYVEEWNKPPMVAGNWVPELLQAVGAEPFNRELGKPSAALSWEELMEFDPEIVIYSICGLATRFDPAEFLKVEGWNSLSAAKNRRVFSVDDSLFNRPGPRLVEAGKLVQGLMDEIFNGGPQVQGPFLRRCL